MRWGNERRQAHPKRRDDLVLIGYVIAGLLILFFATWVPDPGWIR